MEIKMIDVFLQHAGVKVEEEDIKPLGRQASRRQYEKLYEDERDRQDRESYRLEDPRASIDPRRWKEMADGGMVREDRNAMANLSGQFLHYEYPKLPFNSTPYVNSLMKSRRNRGG